MTVEMVPVESSNILGVGYDEEEETLYVTFHSGSRYCYGGVSRAIHEAFMAAPSKGKFFHASIKGRFLFEKLGGGTDAR